jgi:ribosomal protein S18 acetylase RimI-like enzyme
MHIRILETPDLAMVARHRLRHSRENGRDGDYIFAPVEEEPPINDTDLRRESEALSREISIPDWQRGWILTDEREIYGELILVHRPPLKTCLHRCMLMMGLERAARQRGWGSKLMEEGIRWAKQQPSLHWVQLFVFESNAPAKALYEKFGFKSGGTTLDKFRVFGASLDDTEMNLRLKK